MGDDEEPKKNFKTAKIDYLQEMKEKRKKSELSKKTLIENILIKNNEKAKADSEKIMIVLGGLKSNAFKHRRQNSICFNEILVKNIKQKANTRIKN